MCVTSWFVYICIGLGFLYCFFFFKQKTAYEMRISDWSSDVCSSDLIGYLLPSDTIVMNRHELLYVAVREAATLAESGWRAPLPALFPVAGRDAIATDRKSVA